MMARRMLIKKEMNVQQVNMRSMMNMRMALNTSQGMARPLLLVRVLVVTMRERAMLRREIAERMMRMMLWLSSTQLTAAQTDLVTMRSQWLCSSQWWQWEIITCQEVLSIRRNMKVMVGSSHRKAVRRDMRRR